MLNIIRKMVLKDTNKTKSWLQISSWKYKKDVCKHFLRPNFAD